MDESSSEEKVKTEEVDETMLKYGNAFARLNSIANSHGEIDRKGSMQVEIEIKKVLQELNNNLETLVLHQKYHIFFANNFPIMLQYLKCSPKNYIKEHNTSQIRLFVLELISRFPLVVTKNFLNDLFPVLYMIMELDNEDNACIAFRILFDLQRRIPKSNEEVKKLFHLIKKFLSTLMQNAQKVWSHIKSYRVVNMEELEIEPILEEIFVPVSISQGETQCVNLLPRGINSLKLMSEIPINLIMLSQVFREWTEVEDQFFELLQLTTQIVVIEPSEEQKSSETFNFDAYTDFLSVQVKYFSFLTYKARTHENDVKKLQIGERFPLILLTLLKNIPGEMTALRKDVLHSLRYLMTTNFRNNFAPYIEEFLKESIIVGNGWGAKEALRSFSYSIVFDLVHHLRESLELKQLNSVINIYSKNLYDDTISLSIHVMSCRLLVNIIDSYFKVAEKEKCVDHFQGALFKILETYTIKICLMAKYTIPRIKAKMDNEKNTKKEPATNQEIRKDFNDNCSNYKNRIEYLTSSFMDDYENRLNFGIPEPQINSIGECRILGKHLLNGLKQLSLKLSDFARRAEFAEHNNRLNSPITSIKTGYCRPKDISVLMRLFKKGIKFLEIYNTNKYPSNIAQPLNRQQMNTNHFARTKEEKDMIDAFSAIFTTLSAQTFRVVVKSQIDYFVNSINENCNIQQLANCFLAHKNISPVFADILTNYLVDKMEVMGNNTEMSNLFLKLFKLVFGSVSLLQIENERMLQPYLRKLVNNSMKLAMNSLEPYNYFMLLRALFRSIGGGSHDQLYREFLPMLPSLLEGLNNFQAGIHRQNMKDLFVELCLTIPVRLSSLLPYLPYLMDPLVSALNGAPSLISQGLRTLELCVDNLQPDFLHAHFEPIRIELMQSLWRTLRCQNDNIAQISLRILGKLGGANHRSMIEPQKLDYIEFRDPLLDENGVDTRQTENMNIPSHGSCSFIEMKFDEYETTIHLPVDKVIESAYSCLRSSTTDDFYREQCWEVIKGFLIANMENFSNEDVDKQRLHKLFQHPSFSTGTDFGYSNCSNSYSFSSSFSNVSFYKFPDEKLRKVHELALTAMLTASAIKKIHNDVIEFMIPLVRYYTLVAICQQSGPINISGRIIKLHGMDPLVLFDAITAVMGQEEKELFKPCHLVLTIIIDITAYVIGHKDRTCQLPFFEYILERVCALCYGRAWYSKYGGCVTIRYLFERMSLRWLLSHQFVILKAMLFVMMDLYGDLSSGVIEIAKENLENMIKICGKTLPEDSSKDLFDLQQKSMSDVVQELLRQITSSNVIVREEAMHLLEVLAKIIGCTVTDVIKPHKEILEDMVPFKRNRLFQQPVEVQIGILDGNTFCIKLEPQLFTIDINISEHLAFFNDVCHICESDDTQLKRLPCFKNIEPLTPLRKAALRTLSASACQNWTEICKKIFFVIFKALVSSDDDLSNCAFDCMNDYKSHKDVSAEIHSMVRNYLLNINDTFKEGFNIKEYKYVQRLKNVAKLFADLFNDKFCQLMFSNLNHITEHCFKSLRHSREKEYEIKLKANSEQQVAQLAQFVPSHNATIFPLKIGAEIIYLFCEVSACDSGYVEAMINVLVKAEATLDIFVHTVYYEPLFCFMKRYPKEALQQFEQRMNEENVYRFFLYVLNHKDGGVFRSVLYDNPSHLVDLLMTKSNNQASTSTEMSQPSPQQSMAGKSPSRMMDTAPSPKSSMTSFNPFRRYQIIKIIYLLMKHDNNWLNGQPELIKILKTIWFSDSFHKLHHENFQMDSKQWEEPRLIIKCLLNYLQCNQHEFELYFQLLLAFTCKYHCDFDFLRTFFETNVKEMSISWKRNAFLRFCEIFSISSSHLIGVDCPLEWSQDLKAKILQFVIIPIFASVFKNGQNEEFLGSPDDEDSSLNNSSHHNLVTVFLNVLVKDPKVTDEVQILVIQLGCLIVEHASHYLRPSEISETDRVPRNKRQSAKIKILVLYIWSGIKATKRHDSVKKYYCHLLMSHIISKITIHKSIIKQVLPNLLKGYFIESRMIVFAALEIFIPVLPQRIKNGYHLLRQHTKKYLIEEGHVTAQVNHLLQIIARYYRIFYPSRNIYIPHMINAMNRLFAQNSNSDQKKFTLDLVEVIIRWEHERVSSESTNIDKSDKQTVVDSSDSESSIDSKPDQTNSSQTSKSNVGVNQLSSHGTMEKEHGEAILLFMIRFICTAHDNMNVQPNNLGQNYVISMTIESQCRRALTMLKDVLQNEFWPLSALKLDIVEAVLSKRAQQNYNNICMALELLLLLLQTLKRDVAIQMLMPLQRAISACCNCTNSKVVSTLHNLLVKLMAMVQPSCHSSTISPKSGQPVKVVNDTLETFEQLYTDIHSLILNGFMSYNKIGQPTAVNNNLVGTPVMNPGNVPMTNINVQLMQQQNLQINRGQPIGAAGPGIAGVVGGNALINSTTTSLSQLFSVLMCLKAACINEPMYIDRVSTPFSVMLTKLVKEHISIPNPNNDANASLCADIINLCLELIKNRIGTLNPETRRTLLSNVFGQLIDKSPEVKVMRTLLKIFEEWIRQPLGAGHGSRTNPTQTCAPALRERTTLILRIGQNIEKRFPNDQELHAQYLEMIYFIYSDENLRNTDLSSKLEFAFMWGLRCSQPTIRQKFFSILDNHYKRSLYERIMLIITGQNWETIGSHFWIKQAEEIVISTVSRTEKISTANQNAKLPLPTSLIPLSDHQEKSLLTTLTSNGALESIGAPIDMLMNLDLSSFNTNRRSNNVEMMQVSGDAPDVERTEKKRSNFLGEELFNATNKTQNDKNNNAETTSKQSATSDPKPELLEMVCDFLERHRHYQSWPFFNAVAQLCHLDNDLAHYIWIQLFPRVYSILNERQQMMIAAEMAPFFISGIHTFQRETKISALNTFFEAISHCEPPIKFRPSILRYLSKNHNVWHRASLSLESDMDLPETPAMGMGGLITNDCKHQLNSVNSMTTNNLSQKHTRSLGSQINGVGGSPHMNNGVSNGGVQLNNCNLTTELPMSLSPQYNYECMSVLANIYETLKEDDYWAGIWNKRNCYPETLIAIAYEQQGFFEQAKGAYELAMSKGSSDFTVNPIPTRLQDEFVLWEEHWIRCSKELNQWDFLLEYGSTPTSPNPYLVLESAWRIPDWNAMNTALSLIADNAPKEYAWKVALYQGYNAICNMNLREIENVEQMVELAANFLLNDWRRLPTIVSAAHIGILQGAHQVIELQEACTFHQIMFNLQNNIYTMERPGPDVRSIIKTWKNRLPAISDDLSHWSDIFTWRQHHYQAIASRFEQDARQQQGQQPFQTNALCGAHASAQSLIHLAKVARKHFLINVALDQLNRIHTIPKVPIMDCFQKIRQQLKCYLLKHALQPSGEELQEAMSVIDCTHLNFFQTEMMAEFIALKGYVLMKMKRMEEANKNLSASVQILDTVVNSWALWAEFNYELFMDSCKDSFEDRNMEHGINAIISYLHAARMQNENKSRKFLSHVLWLLSYDKNDQLAQTVDKWHLGVPACNWAPWIQQLLQCLLRCGGPILNIILQISRVYPEAVYYPTRILYVIMKMEAREIKYKMQLYSAAVGLNQPTNPQSSQDQVQASTGVWRCTRIMHFQKELYPTLLTSIEGIIEQMSWFRENSFEEILRQLRQALAKCYTIAFENRENVAETVASGHILAFIKKIFNTFGLGLDNFIGAGATGASSGGGGGGSVSSNVSGHSNTTSSNVGDYNPSKQNVRGSATAARHMNLNTTASETLARRAQSTVQDPDFQKMKQQFANDFDFSVQGSNKLHNLIVKLKKWIKILEAKTKLLPKSWLLEEKCRYLSNFSKQIAEIALPGEFFLPKQNKYSIIHIDRFMPRVEIISKHNTSARRLYIRGHNGKIFPYLVLNDSSVGEVRREERFLHLMRFLNVYLTKHKETSRRVLNFTVARVVPISAQMRFVEDNVSSLSLIEIYKQHMIRRGSDPDAPIAKYYDRLLSIQTKNSQIPFDTQLKDIVSDIQSSMAPKTLLKEWAMQTFSTATDFWHFRKLFTLQLGLDGLLEYAFRLTRLNPDMMYIHRDSGLMNISYFRFDLDEEKGEFLSKRPVPFRVTQSVQNLISDIGILGPLPQTMIATASCLTHPNFKVRPVLLTIFRDEITNWYKRNKSSEKMALITAAIAQTQQMNQSKNVVQKEESVDQQQQMQQQLQQKLPQLADLINSYNLNEYPEMNNEELVTLVTKGVNIIMSRLQNMATFDGTESKVATLINTAIDPDNLCQMDPAWHPWL